MNQPLDFVTHDLEMMMPGGQPMLTSGNNMYNSQPGMQSPPPPGFGTQSGYQPNPFNRFWLITY